MSGIINPGGSGGVAVTIGGNTAGVGAIISSGTMVLAGGPNVTISQDGQSLSISAAAGAATNVMSAGVSTLGNSSGTTGTVAREIVFAGGNGITLSQSIDAGGSSATITVSGITQSVQTQVLSAGLSNIGNTAGDTGLVSRRLVLAGGNGITLSGSTNGSSMTITVSGITQSVQTQVLSAGISDVGNTAGDTGLVSRQMVLAGGNGITLSGSTNGSSITITVSGITQSVQTQVMSAGLSNLGNTAGDTGTVSRRVVFAGGNNITLSGSTNGSSMTITISAGAGGAAPTLSYYDNVARGGPNATIGQSMRSLHVFPLFYDGLFPGNMTVNTVLFQYSLTSVATDSTYGSTLTFGIYTLNAATLSLLNSGSTAWSHAATAAANQSSGRVFISMHSSLFSAAPSFSQTQYWGAVIVDSANLSMGSKVVGFYSSIINGPYFGTLGANTGSNSTYKYAPFLGVSNGAVTTLPTAIEKSEIVGSNNNYQNVPRIIFDNALTLF